MKLKGLFSFLLGVIFVAGVAVSCTPASQGGEGSSLDSSSEIDTSDTPEVVESVPRAIFVSDLHFNLGTGQGKWNDPYGMTAEDRAQYLVDMLLAEKRAASGDLYVFILGDLTSSEYDYQLFDPLHKNYSSNKEKHDLNKDGTVDLYDYFGSDYDAIAIFQKKYVRSLERRGVYVYCTPGNHDTYKNDEWNNLFGYGDKKSDGSFRDKNVLLYNETDAEYAVRINDDTAVLILNAFNEARGAMTVPRDTSKPETYFYTGQQTLGYTVSDIDFIRSSLDTLLASGYRNIYIASHMVTANDTLQTIASEYEANLRAFIFGDYHTDNAGKIGNVPTYCDGHFSQSMMWKDGLDLSQEKLPWSYTVLDLEEERHTLSYKKTEGVYLGVDNKAYLEGYFDLTPVPDATAADDNEAGSTIVGLTTPKTGTNASGTEIDLSTIAYYRYRVKDGLSEADAARAARLLYFLNEYNLGVRLVDGTPTGSTGLHYNYCYLSYQRRHLAHSFYVAEEIYKSYTIALD